MGEEYWLLVGLAVPAVLLVVGYWCGWTAGRASLDDRVLLEEERVADRDERLVQLAAQIQELLEQGPAGVEAARIVLETERRLGEARAAATPRGRRRGMLGAAPETDADDHPPTPPAGGAEGPGGGAAQEGGGVA